MSALFFFFFQAEDGIRDLTVTGVQTCALPISRARLHPRGGAADRDRALQLLRAELSQGPSRPRRPGLVLSRRGPAAAHPYLARADSHARALSAADPRRDPGPGVPPGPLRRLALAGVRADRGPGGGRRHQ